VEFKEDENLALERNALIGSIGRIPIENHIDRQDIKISGLIEINEEKRRVSSAGVQPPKKERKKKEKRTEEKKNHIKTK